MRGNFKIEVGTNGTQLSQFATNNLSTEDSLKNINGKNRKMRPKSPEKSKGVFTFGRVEES